MADDKFEAMVARAHKTITNTNHVTLSQRRNSPIEMRTTVDAMARTMATFAAGEAVAAIEDYLGSTDE